MKRRISTSFVIFLTALILSVGTITAAYLFAYFKANKDDLIYLGLSQSMVGMVTPLGIYIGFKSASKKLNKLGLWGNTALFLYTAGLIIYAFNTSWC